MIKEEQLQKVINKSFDTLESKMDNILSHDISRKVMTEGLTVYRTEKAHSAYKEKAVWGDGLYLGISKEQVADMTTNPYSSYVETPDYESVKEYRIPSSTKLKEFNLDTMPTKEFNSFPKGNDLKNLIINEGYDGVILYTEGDLNLGGDQVIIYNPKIIDVVLESKHSSKLTGDDIFDITTTEMPYYNSMIQKGHIAGNRNPVEYFKQNKGLIFEIFYMSPEEYIKQSYIIQGYSDIVEFPTLLERYMRITIDKNKVKEYKERTLSGSKMPIPVLDYDNISQEGRHRAIVAQQLDVQEIPVLVVRTYNE